MDFPSGFVTSPGLERRSSTARDRRYYRHPVTSLAYVRLDHANGGIIRNLSESGIAIQAVGRLHPAQVVHLRFELLKPKIRIDATGEVAWADSSGGAGLHFVDLPARTQRHLRDWIFTDLLAAATEFGPNYFPIFGNTAEEERADGLMVSATPVPAIPVEQPIAAASIQNATGPTAEMPLRLPWWPLDIYPRSFARFVDSLVVMSAVLLFAVVAIETIGIVPTWSLAAVMAIGLGGIFGTVYYYFFKYLSGTTLGNRLARLAADDMHWMETETEDVPRFR
jgi:hypothetical protein